MVQAHPLLVSLERAEETELSSSLAKLIFFQKFDIRKALSYCLDERGFQQIQRFSPITVFTVLLCGGAWSTTPPPSWLVQLNVLLVNLWRSASFQFLQLQRYGLTTPYFSYSEDLVVWLLRESPKSKLLACS